MKRILGVIVLCVVVFSACGVQEQPDSARPNVVFFLIDDLGWTDTGAYGSTFYETPNIDRLAAEGARFTQFYAGSPVCSPTRASIMTGKNPRVHITNWTGGEAKGKLLQAEYLRELPLEEVTLGKAFEEAGYSTGYLGKWHLGQDGHLPDAQGFEFIKAVNHAGQPGSYFYPYANDDWPITNVPDLEVAFKLIEWLEDGSVELYDLENDAGETQNLAATMPQKADELKKLLDNWRRRVDANMPIPNPDWGPKNARP